MDQSESSKLMMCKLQHFDEQCVVTRSVVVNNDLTWSASVHGKVAQKCDALKQFPLCITSKPLLSELLVLADTLMCWKFIDLGISRKGKFQSPQGTEVACIDSYCPVRLDGQLYLALFVHEL